MKNIILLCVIRVLYYIVRKLLMFWKNSIDNEVWCDSSHCAAHNLIFLGSYLVIKNIWQYSSLTWILFFRLQWVGYCFRGWDFSLDSWLPWSPGALSRRPLPSALKQVSRTLACLLVYLRWVWMCISFIPSLLCIGICFLINLASCLEITKKVIEGGSTFLPHRIDKSLLSTLKK